MIPSTPHQKRLFQLIFLPLMKLMGISMMSYLLITRLLKFQMLRDNTVDYIAPFLIAWICCLIWIRPRLRILKSSDYRDANTNLFWAVLLIALPVIAARQYIKKDTGKLKTLSTIYHIEEDNALNRYYRLEYYFFDKKHASFIDFQETRDKGRKRTFYRYYTIPIVDNQTDTLSRKCSAWLGIGYSREISNSRDTIVIQDALMDFKKKATVDFDKSNTTKFIYLERLGNTNDHDMYNKAIDLNIVYKNQSELGYNTESYRVLTPVNEPFENRTNTAGLYVMASLFVPLAFWLWLQTKQVDESAFEHWMETDA